MKLLVETEGVDLNSKDSEYGQTPLSLAAQRGHEAVVKILIGTAPVVVDPRDKTDRTLLSWAVANGHDVVVKLLIGTEGVNVNSKDSEYGSLGSRAWA